MTLDAAPAGRPPRELSECQIDKVANSREPTAPGLWQFGKETPGAVSTTALTWRSQRELTTEPMGTYHGDTESTEDNTSNGNELRLCSFRRCYATKRRCG